MMASDFIGYTILVTLNNPPHAQIQGVVANVVNQQLYLHDVTFLWTGQRVPLYILNSTAITDLEIAPSQPAHRNLSLLSTVPPRSAPSEKTPTSSQPPAFVDPAILSYAKPNMLKEVARPASAQPVSPIMIADGATPSPMSFGQRRSAAKQSSVSSINTTTFIQHRRRDSQATAVLTEPFDALALKDEVRGVDGKKKTITKKAKDNQSQTGPGIIDVKDINGPLKPGKKQGRGKGWRQTPMIEEITNRPKKQRGRKVVEDANGWATEDATDIQEMGDFDFASNLSKFDKRQVFDDIRRDDTTADEERLVSFNRKAKPGTSGGRNLHFTENVLDPPHAVDRWKSEAGETDEEHREEPYSSGRGSRRAGSKRRIASRKGSVIPDLVERTESPRPLTRITSASPLNGSISGVKASFRLPNNKPCHCVSPLQMLEIEQLCTSELGLTEDMLSENAGRSIAMAVLSSTPDVRSVVLLVGNHKSGARAVVAARHLRNRRLRVTVVVLGGEREEMLLEVMRKQLATYRKGQGYVDRWDEYLAKAVDGAAQPDVIVDALLGIHVAFDELRTDDQATAFEMIRWASRSSNVLSVDIPSGLSATSGLITETEGQLLVMNSYQIIALGAPKIGLLHAMAMDGVESGWQVMVADIGISTAAWQKHGSRRKHGIEFGAEWLLAVRFVSA